jgi:hypothetical protein
MLTRQVLTLLSFTAANSRITLNITGQEILFRDIFLNICVLLPMVPALFLTVSEY